MLFRVTVLKCSNLPSMDTNGFSGNYHSLILFFNYLIYYLIYHLDPFVQLWVVNSKTNKYLEPPKNPADIKQTKTIMKNLNPIFNETFEFDFSEKMVRKEIDSGEEFDDID